MGCRFTSSVIASITTTSSSTNSSSSSSSSSGGGRRRRRGGSIACSVPTPRRHLYRLPSCHRSTNLIVIILIVLTFLAELSSVLAIALPSSNGRPSYMRYVERERASPSERKTNQVVRHYKLHNRCSGHHVSIVGRHVEALAPIRNQNARLRFETVSFGSRVRIQSEISREFLCFNKRGQLIVRWEGVSSRCVFREVHASNGFTEFQSAANSSWYVGFGRNGRRLPGLVSQVSVAELQTTRRHRDSDNNMSPSVQIIDVPLDDSGHGSTRSTLTSRSVVREDTGGSSSAAAKAASKAATIRRCYQFTKTDFPYMDDHLTNVGDDTDALRNSEEETNGEGSSSSSSSSIRRLADGSTSSARGDSRRYDADRWAPRIDYRYWFDRQKLNRQTAGGQLAGNDDDSHRRSDHTPRPKPQQRQPLLQQPRRKQRQRARTR